MFEEIAVITRIKKKKKKKKSVCAVIRFNAEGFYRKIRKKYYIALNKFCFSIENYLHFYYFSGNMEL